MSLKESDHPSDTISLNWLKEGRKTRDFQLSLVFLTGEEESQELRSTGSNSDRALPDEDRFQNYQLVSVPCWKAGVPVNEGSYWRDRGSF